MEPDRLLHRRLGRSFLLQRLLAEAVEAGAKSSLVLAEKDSELAAELLDSSNEFDMLTVPGQLGTADAIATAQIEDDILVLPPSVVFQAVSPAKRMAALLYRGMDGCVAVQAPTERSVEPRFQIDEGIGAIRSLGHGKWVSAYRYGFGLRLVSFLNEYCGDPSNRLKQPSLSINDLIVAAIAQGLDLRAIPVQPDQLLVPLGTDELFHAARWMQWTD